MDAQRLLEHNEAKRRIGRLKQEHAELASRAGPASSNVRVALLASAIEQVERRDSDQKVVIMADTDACATVLAGPGSGKTSTVISRVSVMLSKGVLAKQICILSFSRAAVQELRARCRASMQAKDALRLNISTYHSLAMRIVRDFVEQLPSVRVPTASGAEECPDFGFGGPGLTPSARAGLLTRAARTAIWEKLVNEWTEERAWAEAASSPAVAQAQQGQARQVSLPLPGAQARTTPYPTAGQQQQQQLEIPVSRCFVRELSRGHAQRWPTYVSWARGGGQATPLAHPLEDEGEGPGEDTILCVLYAHSRHTLADGRVQEFTLLLEERGPSGTSRGRVMAEWKRRTLWANETWNKIRLSGLDYTACERSSDKEVKDVLSTLGRRFQERLVEENCIEFADYILLATHCLTFLPAARAKYGPMCWYIIADEFQDTSGVQLALLTALSRAGMENLRLVAQTTATGTGGGGTAGPVDGTGGPGARILRDGERPALLAVGDPKQAIYGFQGSVPAVFQRIEEAFPGMRRLLLNNNYRSTRSIIACFNEVIRTLAPDQMSQAQPSAPQGPPVRFFRFRESKCEVLCMINALVSLRAHNAELRWRDMAVLTRFNDAAIQISHALWKCGIPFTREKASPSSHTAATVIDALSRAFAVIDCIKGHWRAEDLPLDPITGSEHAMDGSWFGPAPGYTPGRGPSTASSSSSSSLSAPWHRVDVYPYDKFTVQLTEGSESAARGFFIAMLEKRTRGKGAGTAVLPVELSNVLRLVRLGRAADVLSLCPYGASSLWLDTARAGQEQVLQRSKALLAELENPATAEGYGLKGVSTSSVCMPFLRAWALACRLLAHLKDRMDRWKEANRGGGQRKKARTASSAQEGVDEEKAVRERWDRLLKHVRLPAERLLRRLRDVFHTAKEKYNNEAANLPLATEVLLKHIDSGAATRTVGSGHSSYDLSGSSDPSIEAFWAANIYGYNNSAAAVGQEGQRGGPRARAPSSRATAKMILPVEMCLLDCPWVRHGAYDNDAAEAWRTLQRHSAHAQEQGRRPEYEGPPPPFLQYPQRGAPPIVPVAPARYQAPSGPGQGQGHGYGGQGAGNPSLLAPPKAYKLTDILAMEAEAVLLAYQQLKSLPPPPVPRAPTQDPAVQAGAGAGICFTQDPTGAGTQEREDALGETRAALQALLGIGGTGEGGCSGSGAALPSLLSLWSQHLAQLCADVESGVGEAEAGMACDAQGAHAVLALLSGSGGASHPSSAGRPKKSRTAALLEELCRSKAEDQEPDAVYVGTLHSSKGREWEVVWLPRCDDVGRVSHARTAGTAVEEEREEQEEQDGEGGDGGAGAASREAPPVSASTCSMLETTSTSSADSGGQSTVTDVVVDAALAAFDTTLADERRLFYVGLSRGKRVVLCSESTMGSAKVGGGGGGAGGQDGQNPPCPFLQELSAALDVPWPHDESQAVQRQQQAHAPAGGTSTRSGGDSAMAVSAPGREVSMGEQGEGEDPVDPSRGAQAQVQAQSQVYGVADEQLPSIDSQLEAQLQAMEAQAVACGTRTGTGDGDGEGSHTATSSTAAPAMPGLQVAAAPKPVVLDAVFIRAVEDFRHAMQYDTAAAHRAPAGTSPAPLNLATPTVRLA